MAHCSQATMMCAETQCWVFVTHKTGQSQPCRKLRWYPISSTAHCSWNQPWHLHHVWSVLRYIDCPWRCPRRTGRDLDYWRGEDLQHQPRNGNFAISTARIYFSPPRRIDLNKSLTVQADHHHWKTAVLLQLPIQQNLTEGQIQSGAGSIT